MSALSGQEIIRSWELGLGQPAVQQALILLAVALPDCSWEELASLSIGQRDTRLLTIREQVFGPQVAGLAHCPACQEQVEFACTVADLRADADGRANDGTQQLSSHGWDLLFHLPDSYDLAAIAGCADLAMASRTLLQRCVLEVRRNGSPAEVEGLPAEVIAALEEQLAERDPQAEVLLDLTCPACGQCWQVVFDIVSFLWKEISTQAKRLLREVHTLARAYGWSEREILLMSAARRGCYLEMISNG